ncbi:MAG: hypothetical protein LBL04_06815 [Bacteroidales bacterium]|jgi:peroxiredoxin|nr:hypothetical protein [Bacteroidales bacterium]
MAIRLHNRIEVNVKHFAFLFLIFTLHSSLFTAKAYRIEISNQAIAGAPVFLAGYYGDQVSVIDSALTDASGKAVFERDDDLCAGIYTIVAPGKLSYDMLLDAGQQVRMEWTATNDVRIEGDTQTAVYAAYHVLKNTRPGKERLAERRQQIIDQYPNTFLAAYFTALQPVEPSGADTAGDVSQLMKAYRHRRRHFFDHMPLSDVRLLRTPLYDETVRYYVTKFVTQQTDSLIHIAYRMLEQASGNDETFFYVSDFLLDFSLRHQKIKDIHKLHNFVQRNRDMLGVKGYAMLPARQKTNYFKVPDEKSLQNRLENMPLTDIKGQAFNPLSIRSKYRVYYFWKNDCPRCIADASRWQAALNRYQNKSCFGIAVNTQNSVQQQENRILAYEPLCINVSIGQMPLCETIFFVTYYSKIVVTDTDGHIIGIFGSSASLDNFLKIAR